MQKLDISGEVTPFAWQIWDPDSTSADAECNRWLVPLQHFSGIAGSANDSIELGVLVQPDAQFDALEAIIDRVAIVAIDFPSFTDGRGFSICRWVREHLNFSGEIVAYGNFMRDQLFYLKRCGFSGFIFADNVEVEAMADSLADFSDAYQASVDQPLPLFRRREL